MKVWVVVIEDLFSRASADDYVASTGLFLSEDDARIEAMAEAERRGYVWSPDTEVWYDPYESAGLIRYYEQEVK